MKLKRRDFLKTMSASIAAILTWRPTAIEIAERRPITSIHFKDSDALKGVIFTNERLQPDIIASSTEQPRSLIDNPDFIYQDTQAISRKVGKTTRMVDIAVRVSDADGPLADASVYLADEDNEGWAFTRSLGVTDKDGLYNAGKFPIGLELLLRVRKAGWFPWEKRFTDTIIDGEIDVFMRIDSLYSNKDIDPKNPFSTESQNLT